MRIHAEVLVQVPKGATVTRGEKVGPIKVKRITVPHEKNADFDPLGVTAELSGSFNASSTIEGLALVERGLASLGWLDNETLIDLTIESRR